VTGTTAVVAGTSDWRELVISDESLIRPTDRTSMVGYATKATDPFGWKPTKTFQKIVVAMVESDLNRERES
jgi:GDPmannose 4,6-dehydratase